MEPLRGTRSLYPNKKLSLSTSQAPDLSHSNDRSLGEGMGLSVSVCSVAPRTLLGMSRSDTQNSASGYRVRRQFPWARGISATFNTQGTRCPSVPARVSWMVTQSTGWKTECLPPEQRAALLTIPYHGENVSPGDKVQAGALESIKKVWVPQAQGRSPVAQALRWAGTIGPQESQLPLLLRVHCYGLSRDLVLWVCPGSHGFCQFPCSCDGLRC